MEKPSALKPPRDRRPLVAKALFAAAIVVVLALAALLYMMAT